MEISERTKKRIMAKHVIDNAVFHMRQASAQKLGALGEIYVMWWFVLQGFDAIDTSGLRHKGDVTVYSKLDSSPIRIEVKTAKPDKQGNYQFCLRKRGKTDISHSDKVALLAIDERGELYRYLVPKNEFGNSRKVAITSHPLKYVGKLSRWLVTDEIVRLSS